MRAVAPGPPETEAAGRAALRAWLDELPERDREIVTLTAWED